LNRASKGPKKSGILNLSFLTTRKQGRKPDAMISNAGIRGAGRFGLAATGRRVRRLFHTGEAPASGD